MLDLTKCDRNALSGTEQTRQSWQLMIDYLANQAQKNAPKEPALNGRNLVQKLLGDGKRPAP
jgi:hypothetical protein